MNTSAYESTVSMMSGLDDADLMLIKEFIIRISLPLVPVTVNNV